MLESLILSVMMKDRDSFDLITSHIAAKEYSREFQIISDHIKAYYDRDNSARYVDLTLLRELISGETPNEKHRDRFLNIVDEAYAADTSAENVEQIVLNAKKNELANQLSIAIVNGKEHEALLDQYRDMLQFTRLDDLLEKGVEVYDASDLDDLLAHEVDPTTRLKVYPLALNERLEGGLRGSDHLTLFARPEMAKCLAVGTKVLMADGSERRVEDVLKGECVAGPSGPRLVTATSRGRAPMYKVTYPWGESYVVNDEHILSLKRSKTEDGHAYGDILNVKVSEYVNWPTGRKQRYKGWKSGLDFEHRELPLDPYLFGLWLGDGSTGKPTITTVDAEVLTAFTNKYGQPTRTEKGITHSFGHSGLRSDLKATGAFETKHIPMEYLTASRVQRLQLLAGIVDSDGYASSVGYEITTKSDELKHGYLYLVRSLGFHATARRIFSKASGTSHEGDWYWKIYVGAEAFGETPVRVPRKKKKQSSTPKRNGLQFGIQVEPVGEGEYAGFCLDGDHLFLLADFTVTHNTALVLTMACGFARQGKIGIVFNNEERIERLRMRALSCCTGMTAQEIRANPQAARDIAEQMGYHNIIFVSLSPGHPRQIEAFVDKYKAQWFIVDQIRNLAMKSENRTNQLEAAAQAVRNIGKKYDAVAVSVTQAGDSAEGKSVLEMGDVDGSNTGIPGACDVLLGVGATFEQKEQGIRVLSLCKNKVGGIHANFPVRFNQWLSKYVSIQE